MDIVIRPELEADVAAIENLTARAFRHAPYSKQREQHIIQALRAAGSLQVSLVATAAGIPVGHVAASPVTIEDGACGWCGLGPVAVLPEYQRRGIGSALIRAALEALRAQGARGCVVLGEAAFYRRFGFEPYPDLILPGVPPGYFQAQSFASAKPRGKVFHHRAFQA